MVTGIKSEVNVDDTLSLGFFKTFLGLTHISNQPDIIKKDGNYEAHAQFCEDVGKELLIEAFKTFVKNQSCQVVRTEKGAVDFILDFLDTSDIKYFYNPAKHEESAVFDDMLTSSRDIAGRCVVSMVLKSVEHEADGLGLRAARTVMIPYFLNRKEDHQDSKYAQRLLFNKVAFLQSSQRTQARIDNMACCNPSGKLGRSIARDQENEHKVKTTKMVLRGLHSQLTDLTVEKATLGSNILQIVESHDLQAMMLQEGGGRTSHRYLSDAQKQKIRDEIVRMKPFNIQREKVEYFDKTRGMFSGLTIQQLDRFLIRNKANYKRNSPHRSRMDDLPGPGVGIAGIESAGVANVPVSAGGTSVGGMSTGGSITGGIGAGGASAGGIGTGGASAGSISTGGASAGGIRTGGVIAGGISIGVASSGGINSRVGSSKGGTDGVTYSGGGGGCDGGGSDEGGCGWGGGGWDGDDSIGGDCGGVGSD